MEPEAPLDSPDRAPLTPGWKSMAAVAVFYLGCLVVATWPAFATFGTTLPSRVDPLAHLWTMRWNKSCLFEGRLPFFCPNIQHPVGASLGTLPPMHFQTLLYIPLSSAFDNDVLCYNIIRTCSFLLTGLGTFLLIWNVTRSRPAAALGGLLAMISTPMIYFSHGELEQITVGWFPVFLIAWLRFVDRPGVRGLASSAMLYLLVAMSAPYYGVFAIFPAALYVAWRAVGSGWSGLIPWIKARAGWLAAFASVTGPMLLVLFANQIWSMTHGQPMSRPEDEFAMFRAPLWGYLVPPPVNILGRVLPTAGDYHLALGSVPSYLGAVTMALVAYAGAARVRFARSTYWWLVLAMLLVLSFGAYAQVGPYRLGLPAAWLKKYFVGFRMIRVPARFNLFVGVAAALVAAAGFRHLLSKIPHRAGRVAAFSVLATVALADLSTIPYLTTEVPPVPAAYGAVLAADPSATFVDVPQFNSGAFQLRSLCTYWQSFHGGRTSTGYTAFLNSRYDDLLGHNSPFDAFRLAKPGYLASPESQDFEFARGLDFRSYAWLYLKVHDLRYVVVHHAPGAIPDFAVHLDRLKALLSDAKVFEDATTAVYDRDRLPAPSRPVLLYAEGWGTRSFKDDRPTCMVGRSAKVYVYNPTPDRPLRFELEAMANRNPRVVSLKNAGRELVCWSTSIEKTSRLESPPFRLKGGLSELTIESDGEDKPHRADPSSKGTTTPFSLWTFRVGLDQSTDLAGSPEPGTRR